MVRSVVFVASCIVAGLLAWLYLSPEAEPVSLANARAEAASPGTLHVFLDIANPAGPDTLLSAASPDAETVTIVSRVDRDALAIPAGGTPTLSADGAYLRLDGVEGALEDGRLVPVALTFARSGTLSTQARIGPPADPHAMHRAMGGMAMEGMSDRPDPSSIAPAPELSIEVRRAEDGSWTVALTTANFVFDPEVEMPVHVPGHGHGHLYLDGLKLQRVYGDTARIGQLPPGRYTVMVSLNTNTHDAYLTPDGEQLAAAVTITEPD